MIIFASSAFSVAVPPLRDPVPPGETDYSDLKNPVLRRKFELRAKKRREEEGRAEEAARLKVLLSDLPAELLFAMLSQLPAATVLALAATCWRLRGVVDSFLAQTNITHQMACSVCRKTNVPVKDLLIQRTGAIILATELTPPSPGLVICKEHLQPSLPDGSFAFSLRLTFDKPWVKAWVLPFYWNPVPKTTKKLAVNVRAVAPAPTKTGYTDVDVSVFYNADRPMWICNICHGAAVIPGSGETLGMPTTMDHSTKHDYLIRTGGACPHCFQPCVTCGYHVADGHVTLGMSAQFGQGVMGHAHTWQHRECEQMVLGMRKQRAASALHKPMLKAGSGIFSRSAKPKEKKKKSRKQRLHDKIVKGG